MNRENAVALLSGLVSIPSISRQEAAASQWLVEQMLLMGYDRAYVDESGSAVGEIGPQDAERVIVLLGHIDTVPGDIPVRIEKAASGEVLYGRGSVDAKGPLATFTAAGGALGSTWMHEQRVRLVVIGATEEEAATSHGARFAAARFNGVQEPIPQACIIGEPSSWQRITLGYKGRILLELEASQPMAHTAGPDRGVATIAVAWWNWIAQQCDDFNAERPKAFDQLLPSLRKLRTWTDEEINERVSATVGIRLPLDFDVRSFLDEMQSWAAEQMDHPTGAWAEQGDGEWSGQWSTSNGQRSIVNSLLSMRVFGYERAWRSDRNNPLVRSFLAAIREVEPGTRPSFVVKTGTSDMNVVGPVWQCPILAYGPGDSTLDHTPNEHIHLDDYWKAVQVLRQALQNLIR